MKMDERRQIIRTNDFVNVCAQSVVDRIRRGLEEKGKFVFSLAGGKTPEAINRKIVEIGKDIDWSKVIITFSDDRAVPPSHPESNYLMAKQSLFDHINIPVENIIRIEAELRAEEAARLHESRVKDLDHDLIILGLGDDGHCASLFPKTSALNVTEKLVVANYVPKFNSNRITYTYKMIARAKEVCFMVIDDAKKHHAIEEALIGNKDFPAGSITAEKVTWIIGQEYNGEREC